MAETSSGSLISASTAVAQALEPLTQEERERVLHSVAALFGVAVGTGPRVGGAPADLVATGTHENDSAPPTGSKRLSLVEFLNQKNPATNTQLIATFAYYREHIEGKGTNFSKADLQGYFAVAKLPRPANYDRDWRKVVQEGWVHDEGANSYLTRAGEESVRAGFGGKGKARGGAAGKKPRKATKPATE